ncbi:hypothetical protein DASC09_014830 [Saccharomycopsis crataegensis]|uniref:Sodium/calcium exchanger membrane region domain-containing protein n=1 Tax=Saccharomycopsis crataegensis TaxID=43959 RepID=A0AAV5QH29_9ASCO|nr:hypothetical protein DASC09_014830 [Saccharomycopsis crataegensis]
MKLKGIISENTFKPRHMASSARRTALITLKSSYANILLLVVPFALASNNVGWPSLAVFILNFVAIVPLAACLCFATEELAEHLGDNLGAFLNASFGNSVELITAIIALKQGQIRVVQTSMLGSVISNSLLVLGCCFVAGGYNRFKQTFNITAAQTLSSLLILSTSSLMIPAALHSSIASSLSKTETDTITPENPGSRILKLSRGTAIILLLMYLFYLFFQMKTHKTLFEAEVTPADVLEQNQITEKVESEQIVQEKASTIEDSREESNTSTNDGVFQGAKASVTNTSELQKSGTGLHSKILKSRKGTLFSVAANLEEEHLSILASLVVLVIITVLVAFCADYMVGSIDDLVETSGMTKTFVGLVLLPISGNAAEHVTSVVVATKNKMDLAIGVAIGSSTQIALFVTPLLVLIGWWIGESMSLLFTTFECCTMFITIFITNSMIADGESNYLEGVMLISAYVIIAVAFFFFPDSATGLS